MERKSVTAIMIVMILVSTVFLVRTAMFHGVMKRDETEWAESRGDEFVDLAGSETGEENEREPVAWNGEYVVIDPGHGGSDPGKIGKHDVEEKEVNLAIAIKLREKFEDLGYRVVMTREGDRVLEDDEEFDEESGKAADMRKRIDIINGSGAKVMVSIHQNSFEMSEVKGPQVFYYEASEEGRKLAETIQGMLNTELQIAKPREITPNSNYYLLHNSVPVSVIVECGFLSNPEDESKLCDETYQEELADIISRAVDSYYKDGTK